MAENVSVVVQESKLMTICIGWSEDNMPVRIDNGASVVVGNECVSICEARV